MKQRTIKNKVVIEGAGQHTGRKVSLTLKPSPPGSGINFIRTDLPNKPLINIQTLDFTKISSKPRCTAISLGAITVETVEHLMAALLALEIDNIIIELDNEEVPGLDGSAKGFFERLRKAGVKEEDKEKKILSVKEAVWVEGENSFLGIFPAKDFKVSYTLSYLSPRRLEGFYSLVIDEASFEKEIAPARTFCFEEEALALLKMGFGKGANYENTLVLGENGPVRNTLLFPDEPVRHKMLDLIGDLYLVGCQVKGHVVAIKSGHKLNMELVRKLKTSV